MRMYASACIFISSKSYISLRGGIMENRGYRKSGQAITNSQWDLQMEASLIEIYDNKRVLIENHKGITCYECNEIIVKVKNGTVCVCGTKLCLSRMNKSKLVISGIINAVHIHKV